MLRCRALLPHTEHFFTAAPLTLRDDPSEWDAAAQMVGVGRDSLRLLDQVHGRTVVVANANDRARPTADGIITDSAAVALVVRVADCAPILLADRATGAVAAVHAGWRSTLQSIAAAAVQSLRDTYHSRPQDLVVALGPSLGACCGEMGEEVVEAFRAAGHDARSLERWFVIEAGRRPHFDLWRANRDQLEQAGVLPESIHVAGLCTRTHPDVFHSYRAAGQRAGRMAAVIRPNR